MWNERHTLDSLLWEAAHDDMGIYPRATIRDGVETPRTEWQDGWNAAVMALTKKHGQLVAWAKTLSDEQVSPLLEMLDSDSEAILVGIHDDAVVLRILCSDTFGYACADAERVDLRDVPEICRLWKAHGYYGPVAWIARKRHAEPVKEYRYNASYLAAKADLPALEPALAADAVDPQAAS